MTPSSTLRTAARLVQARRSLLSRSTLPRPLSTTVDNAFSSGADYKNHAEFSAVRDAVLRTIAEDQDLLDSMAHAMAFATSEGSKFPSFTSEPDERMQRQLRLSENQLRHSNVSRSSATSTATTEYQAETPSASASAFKLDTAPLPRTLSDALHASSRAIVITETKAPFRIVDVNAAWEGLCGYTFTESHGKTLGELLAGSETNKSAGTALIYPLLQGEPEAGAVLTNYTKGGRKFRNRVRVGPLIDEETGQTSYYVGVLQEVSM